MSSKAKCGAAKYDGGSVLRIAFALLLAGLVCADADAAEQASTVAMPASHAHHASASSSLDSRVATLTKALDLDARQQVELKRVLEGQREQVARVWNDESVPASYRVVATQAIGDKTADQIRALLNDEQRKKYNPPKPRHEANMGSGLSVEEWMKKTQPK